MRAPVVEVFGVFDDARWRSAVESIADADIYFSPEYHRANLAEGEDAFLIYYSDSSGAAAMPLISRPVDRVDGLSGEPHFDATSVYGYSGVLARLDACQGSQSLRDGFQTALYRVLSTLGVVSVFVRQHPIDRCEWLLHGLGNVRRAGTTVAIDLAEDEAKQLAGMTKGHRYDIRKAERTGVTVREGQGVDALRAFKALYEETMDSHNASQFYRFPQEYFDGLATLRDGCARVFFALQGESVVSAALFLFRRPFIQYHLAGTPRSMLKLNGAKAIIDTVRRLGATHGYRFLHLGGGLGGAEDSLFRFKAGFSRHRLPFLVAEHVINVEAYQHLEARRRAWLHAQGRELRQDVTFFPSYRAGSSQVFRRS